MLNLNTRHWSTPAVIAGGLFMSVSGVMMFFGVHRPLTMAHEWIGLTFVVAILFHLLTHWQGVKGYFSQRAAVGILGLVALAATGLILLSANGPDRHDGHHRGHDGERAEAGFESLIGAVHPDRQQADKIRAILDQEAARAASSRQTSYQQIRAVLNDAQRTQYESLIQQRADRQLRQMAEALHLSQEQKAELGAILMLADDRFAPNIDGADLTEAVRGILNQEQAQTLARLSEREDLFQAHRH